MSIERELRFVAALVGTNIKAAFALRGAFWLQAVFMIANNVLFFATWWIFFDRFESVRGWRAGDVMALFGIVAAGFGATVVLFGGIRDLARTISEGELDVFLTQPKSALLHVIGSRTVASGWGDLATGLLFVSLSGLISPATLPIALFAIASSACVFIATGIVLHSLAFWLGDIESLSRSAWEFLITFSTYPEPLFGGALRVVLFTVAPAGFIGYLPVSLLRDFSGAALLGCGIAAATWLVAGAVVFRRGLRRYESGNRIVSRS